DSSGTEQSHHLMRNRIVRDRNLHQILLRRFYRFANRLRHFLGFAIAVSDMTALITDHDERAETQILAALDYLRDTIDRNDGILRIVDDLGVDMFVATKNRQTRPGG